MTSCAVLASMSEGYEICVSGCREHATAQSPRSLCFDREATSPLRAPVVMSPARGPGRSSARSDRRAMVSGVPGPPTAAV